MASGIVSISQDRPDQAIAAFERAIRLSPLDPWVSWAFTFGLAWAHQAARRYEEALN